MTRDVRPKCTENTGHMFTRMSMCNTHAVSHPTKRSLHSTLQPSWSERNITARQCSGSVTVLGTNADQDTLN